MKVTQLFLFTIFVLFIGCKNGADQKAEQPNSSSGNPMIDGITEKIKAEPNNAQLYVERADAYYQGEAPDQAIADLNTAIGLDSLKPNYYHLLADVHYDYYQSKQALETMQKAAELFPTKIQTLLKLSEYQMFLKQHGTSIQTAERILEIAPRHPEALYMIGTNYKHLGEVNKAINYMQSAVEENPDLIDGYVHLGILMDDPKNPKKDKLTLQYLDNALSIDSTNITALYAKAWFFHQRDLFDKAKAWYRKIIIQTPNKADERYVDACFNIGTIYLGEKDLKKAYDHFNIATQLEPTLAKAYYYRGLTAKEQGNIDQAKNDFQQTINLDGNYEKARAALRELGG